LSLRVHDARTTPPPIQDPTLLGNVIEATDEALPVLREQAARIRALKPPSALRTRIARFFTITDRSSTPRRQCATRPSSSTRTTSPQS
jgi:hypothetical protein